MELIIQTPAGIILHEETDAVKLPGSLGPFTILKNHAPIVSLLDRGKIVYQVDGEQKEAVIDGGIARVNDDVIRIITEKTHNLRP